MATSKQKKAQQAKARAQARQQAEKRRAQSDAEPSAAADGTDHVPSPPTVKRAKSPTRTAEASRAIAKGSAKEVAAHAEAAAPAKLSLGSIFKPVSTAPVEPRAPRTKSTFELDPPAPAIINWQVLVACTVAVIALSVASLFLGAA